MPTIEGISGWYRSSQIEYFTPFMKLWLSFNAWYKQKYENISTDRDAIEKLKNYQDIKDRLKQLITLDSNEAKEFRKYLGELVIEIRNESLKDANGRIVCFSNTDLYKNKKLTKSAIDRKMKKGEFIVKLDEQLAITSKVDVVINELLEVIYQIRNYLIHGSFEINDKRAQLLVKNSYIILNLLFKPIIGGS
jgi:hypothetical protein